MRKFAIVVILVVFFINSKAQTIKGMYVDGFSTIVGNIAKEDSLLCFAKSNGFNYLTLYQIHLVNANTPLNNASACQAFTNFISKAKTLYGINQIGVAGENYNFFANNISPYNQQHTLTSEKIDVYNVEFEFWVPSSVSAGGVYCVDYLANGGYACNSNGAFNYYKSMLHKIDSLANANGAISETYFGWFNAAQGSQIVQTGVDRILLSVYIPSTNYSASYQYNYIKQRLQNLASANQIVKVLPIYSAEPGFMQTWANANPLFLPYTHLQNSINAETSSWKNFIQLEGIQWFTYTDMPKANINLHIKLFIQGYYMGSSLMRNTLMNQQVVNNTTVTDSVTIELHNSSSPYSLVVSRKVPLQTNGQLDATFNYRCGLFYIVVKHRNSVETWSANPVIMQPSIAYDFTAFVTQAFGNNQVEVESGIWAIFSGDINQDGFIDNTDFSLWEADANNFVTGYLSTDVDGNGAVDNGDFSIWEANANSFVSVVKP
jgi:hypothetical protein